MEQPLTLERRRTGWDIVLGVLSVIAGAIALGHVALAGAISVLFLGWTILLGGVALAISGRPRPVAVDTRVPEPEREPPVPA